MLVYDIVFVKEESLLYEMHDRTGRDQHTDKVIHSCKLIVKAGMSASDGS